MYRQYSLRIVSVIVLILIISQVFVLAQTGQYLLNVQENKELDVNNLGNIRNGATMTECLQQCLADCQCMSFGICDGNKCYLNPTNSELSPSKLKPSDRCRFFEFKEKNNEQCDRSCMSTVNCCLTSNPCGNGGICSPSNSTESRFQCTCKPGFTGKYCKTCSTPGYTGPHCQNKITSCKGYYNGKRNGGYYTIFGAQNANQTFTVYCDFDKESNMAWTLIQSFSLENVANFKHRFQNNMPNNEFNRPNWSSYRLSKLQMESIKVDCTKWRITCEFQQNKRVDYRDYIQASLQEIDILTLDGEACQNVEYINVRGNNCTNCSAYLYQTSTLSFHFDSFNSLNSEVRYACDFKAHGAISCDGLGGEDDFGYYRCPNEDHRCVTHNNSTTQTWLGG